MNSKEEIPRIYRDLIYSPSEFEDYSIEEDLEETMKNLKQLQQENEQLKEEIQDLKANYGNKAQVERDLLAERINKAIDKITTEQLYTNFTWGKSFYSKLFKELLEILKGEE